jgi:hypothetical protein
MRAYKKITCRCMHAQMLTNKNMKLCTLVQLLHLLTKICTPWNPHFQTRATQTQSVDLMGFVLLFHLKFGTIASCLAVIRICSFVHLKFKVMDLMGSQKMWTGRSQKKS